jgi:hypothetical protein
VLRFVVIGETAALVVADVVCTYFPRCTSMLWLLCLLPSADLAACPSLNASRSLTGPSFCSVFLSLSVVYFLYYFEYRIVGVDVSFICSPLLVLYM